MPVSILSPIKASKFKIRPFRQAPSYGGTLVWGSLTKPTVINPILTQYGISASLLELVFDSLIRIDRHGAIVPGLAQSWEVSADGKQYTFHLKKGVRFHDGVECTAEDAAFTYRQIMDPKNASPVGAYFTVVREWKVLDRYTLAVTLKEPTPAFLYTLRQEIAPKHRLEKETLAGTFNDHPVGTGPFKFKSWDKETGRMELVANPDYFEGRAYLDKIMIVTYPDVTQLWSGLMRHEVDFVQFLNREDFRVIQKDPAFSAYTVTGTMYYAILYNFFHDSILVDPDVRKAIAYGIDRKKLIEELSPGGKESLGPFHEESPGFDLKIKPFEYDPVKAKVYLMHRGWQDTNNDGILEKDGRDFEIRMLVDERFGVYRDIAMQIHQQLAQIGIRFKILLYQDERQLTPEYLKENRVQAWLRTFQGKGNDPKEVLENWYYLSSELFRLWQYKNAEVDRLYENARNTPEAQERFAIYQEIHKLIYEDQPACFLFYPSYFFAVNAKVKNTAGYFNQRMPNYVIKDWYVDRSQPAFFKDMRYSQ